MAEGLSAMEILYDVYFPEPIPLRPTQAVIKPGWIDPLPTDSQYEIRLQGMDPEVQLFMGASDEKTAPNYSDWLRTHSE